MLNDRLTEKQMDRMMKKMPFMMDWCKYHGEIWVAQFNYDASKNAGMPMMDLSHCMTQAINQNVIKTARFAGTWFARCHLSSPGWQTNSVKQLTLKEAFWANVSPSDGCWEWAGTINRVTGYGKLSLFGTEYAAHRLAYQLLNGPIPDGLYVCHRCDNRKCVNSAHLFLGTAKENAQDRVQKGRVNCFQAKKTHCKNGHEFTPENTYRPPSNGRHCKTCRQQREAVYRLKNNQKTPKSC